MSKLHKHRSIKLTVEIEKRIVKIASKNPREGYGLPFSTWSLRVLAGYVSKELNLVDSISHKEIRSILLKHGIKYHRQLKITLGKQHRSRIRFKKKRVEELRYSPPIDSVILYEDEKGPIAAKTYGGPSWSSS